MILSYFNKIKNNVEGVVGSNGAIQVLKASCLFWNDTNAPLPPGATFTGPVRDVGVPAGAPHPYATITASFFALGSGLCVIEVSSDGVRWRRAAVGVLSAATATLLSVPVTARFHRAALLNGSPALFPNVMVNTAYIAA